MFYPKLILNFNKASGKKERASRKNYIYSSYNVH